MIPLIILSAACFLILWWAYFGYFIFLGIARLCQASRIRVASLSEYPSIDILVCCRNEEKLAEWKVENLSQLDYPSEKLEILFLDGSSTDGTIRILEKAVAKYPHMKVIQTGQIGKTAQLNYILPSVQLDLVLNTDMDAELDKNVLTELVKEFASDPSVAVAGALVIPRNSCAEEEQYWRSQNKVRILESEAYSSSIVIAPCYMFRRDLLSRFPDDVIADDIYTANIATVSGKRVAYCKEAIVYETRTPQNSREMFIHKFRKANAYITEVLRFLHYLPRLNLFWRIVFLTRTLQLLGSAWVLLVFLMLLAALLIFRQYEIVILYFLTGLVSLGITHLIIGRVKTGVVQKAGDFVISLKLFLTLTALLVLAALTYPFYRQTSQYTKVHS